MSMKGRLQTVQSSRMHAPSPADYSGGVELSDCRQGPPRLEGVPEATHRVNQDRTRRVFLHLLAQPEHVDIHCPVRNRAILPPDRIEQLLAAEDHARPVH